MSYLSKNKTSQASPSLLYISLSGFLSGATVGAFAGFGGGFVGGAGNAWAGGAGFGQGLLSGLKGGGWGAVSGGLIGGVAGGISAVKSGADFWTGYRPLPEFTTPMLDGSPYIQEPNMPVNSIPQYNKAYVEVGDLSSNARLNNTGFNYDINKAVATLNKNAQQKPTGYCAKYVRLALESGGMDTQGHPGVAYQYIDYLASKGFNNINISGYTPVRGDIIIFSNFKNNIYGHIQMFNGSRWISDFIQKDFWPGTSYRMYKPYYKIFRW